MDLDLYGKDLFGESIRPPSRGPVADRFVFPPFSILDAKQGAWQDRKRAWSQMGIKGEVGRDAPSIHRPTESYTKEPQGRKAARGIDKPREEP